MDKISQNFPPFDPQELLKTPQAQALTDAMQRQYHAQAQQAMELMLSGRVEEAQRLLEPLMHSPEAQQLLRQMGESHG